METQLLDDDVELQQLQRQPQSHGEQQPVAQLRVVSIASIAQARIEPAQVFVDQVWKLYAGKTALGREPPTATHDALHRITMTNDRLQHAYQAEINIADGICHIRNEGASYHLTRSRPSVSSSSTTSTLTNPDMWYELCHGDHIQFGKRITAVFEWIHAPSPEVTQPHAATASTLLLDDEDPDLDQAGTLCYDHEPSGPAPNDGATQLFVDSTEPRRDLGETQVYADPVEPAVPSTLPYIDNPDDAVPTTEATQVYATGPAPARGDSPPIHADQATLVYADDLLNSSHDSGDADSAPVVHLDRAKATQLFDDHGPNEEEAVELPPSPVVEATQLFDATPQNDAAAIPISGPTDVRKSLATPTNVQNQLNSRTHKKQPEMKVSSAPLVPASNSRTPRRSSRNISAESAPTDDVDQVPQLEGRPIRSSRKRKSLADASSTPEPAVTPSPSPAKRRKTAEDPTLAHLSPISGIPSSSELRKTTPVALSQTKRGRVLLTSIPPDKKTTYARYVKDLGWHLIEQDDQNAISPATHIVISKTLTGPTLKLLQAISVCLNLKYVITQEWLECSEKHGAFVEESPFLLPASSPICKTYGFTGDISALPSGPRNKLFLGYTFYVAPSCSSPRKDEICRVVESAGGACTNHIPSSLLDNTVIIGCLEDWELLSKPRALSYIMYTFDLIKFAILKQKIEWKSHQLSTKSIKKN